MDVTLIINVCYFLAALLFILGLKRMSSPASARSGIIWAGFGMGLAVFAAFFTPHLGNLPLIIIAVMIGSFAAFVSAKKVAMTDMPQMIALYNGMGGGAAAAIAAVELISITNNGINPEHHTLTVLTLAVLGAFIGAVSLSGSVIAFAKLQGIIKKAWLFPLQQVFNLLIFIATLVLGFLIIAESQNVSGISGLVLFSFFALALLFGILVAIPIGGADMPVIISLFNALTGLAVAFEGFVLGNAAMIIAGTVVGSAGTLLTQLMAKAMNRSLANVLFSGFGSGSSGEEMDLDGSMKPIEAQDVAVMLAYAQNVIIVPGYGMAVAQAQHKVWEMTRLLQDKGVNVRFAIHPVAGRMPGHMNVLLAEAGVPYDIIADLDEINADFQQADVALVIGANDVVNPAARVDANSPIYGMPILDADKAKNVIVIKRGKGRGFSGAENHLFFADNTRMLYGDGQKMVAELSQQIKEF